MFTSFVWLGIHRRMASALSYYTKCQMVPIAFAPRLGCEEIESVFIWYTFHIYFWSPRSISHVYPMKIQPWQQDAYRDVCCINYTVKFKEIQRNIGEKQLVLIKLTKDIDAAALLSVQLSQMDKITKRHFCIPELWVQCFLLHHFSGISVLQWTFWKTGKFFNCNRLTMSPCDGIIG